ncbi:MAG: hypothetical protein JWR76_497 [Mucilaginibacter sp.]|nr:hypothetical protein [Mucilaginibacter sp.]
MKNPFGIICAFIIGGLIGFYFNSYSKSKPSLTTANTSNAKQIDSARASMLIAEYRKRNGGILRGVDSVFNGFFVDTASLHAILKDKEITGISFYIGMHPAYTGAANNVISFFLTGARPNPKYNSAKAITEPPLINSALVYEYVDPCPKMCGTLAP